MLKVGIIGCGSVTIWRHAPEYHNNPDCKIEMFYDVVPERAQALAEQYGAKWCTDYKEIFNDPNIDAVSICSPNETHAALSIEAMKAGKHVLCEKPFATNLQDAVEMQKVAKATGKNLMAGHSQRYFSCHIEAKKILETGLLGKVISFSGIFKNHGPDFWSIDKGNKCWFFDKNKSYFGALGDLGVHKIDSIAWLINDDFEYVSATNFVLNKTGADGEPIEVPDNTFATLITKNGIAGTVEAGWSCYGSSENSITIYCENGVIYTQDEKEEDLVIITKKEIPVRINTKAMKTPEELKNCGIIDEFVNSILENRTPAISGVDGVKAIAVIEACFESSKNNSVKTKVKSMEELF